MLKKNNFLLQNLWEGQERKIWETFILKCLFKTSVCPQNLCWFLAALGRASILINTVTRSNLGGKRSPNLTAHRPS